MYTKRKKINLLLVCLGWILFYSCEVTPDIDKTISGFTKLNQIIVYPIIYDYRVEFNGKDIIDGFYSREETEGEVNVYYPKDAKEPESTFSWNIAEQGTDIQLIKLPGKKFELYKKEDFITFSNNIIYQTNADNYITTFNGQELVQGLNYYKKSGGLTGKLEITEKGIEEPIFSQEITIDELGGTLLNIMQLSESLFLSIPEDTEPDPVSNQFTKVRFFYTANDFPGVNKLKITVIEWMSLTELGTVEIEPGELSSYITVDWNEVKEKSMGQFNGAAQIISDAETGEIFVDSRTSFTTAININPETNDGFGPYKKATCQVTKADAINPFASLSYKWE